MLLKQIDIANKNTEIAVQVQQRRSLEHAVWQKHLFKMDRLTRKQKDLNQQQRDRNQLMLKLAKKTVDTKSEFCRNVSRR